VSTALESGNVNFGDGEVVISWQAPLASPTLVSRASRSVARGHSLSDQATLGGALKPTGTITFRLYGPNVSRCSAAIFSSKAVVHGNGSYTSRTFAPSRIGAYRWTATYSGDGSNNPASTRCGAASEAVGVRRA
jgi:hypothetical protein